MLVAKAFYEEKDFDTICCSDVGVVILNSYYFGAACTDSARMRAVRNLQGRCLACNAQALAACAPCARKPGQIIRLGSARAPLAYASANHCRRALPRL